MNSRRRMGPVYAYSIVVHPAPLNRLWSVNYRPDRRDLRVCHRDGLAESRMAARAVAEHPVLTGRHQVQVDPAHGPGRGGAQRPHPDSVRQRLGEHLPKLLAFRYRERLEAPGMDRSRPQPCRVRLERLVWPHFRARLARPEMAERAH
jgi:hypothetical protein